MNTMDSRTIIAGALAVGGLAAIGLANLPSKEMKLPRSPHRQRKGQVPVHVIMKDDDDHNMSLKEFVHDEEGNRRQQVLDVQMWLVDDQTHDGGERTLRHEIDEEYKLKIPSDLVENEDGHEQFLHALYQASLDCHKKQDEIDEENSLS